LTRTVALRRFNYKIEFGYLKPDGVVTFYKKILSPLIGWLKVSSSSGQPIKCHPVALIEALKEEAKTKEIHTGKKVEGFQFATSERS
jgi:hypothetical protein